MNADSFQLDDNGRDLKAALRDNKGKIDSSTQKQLRTWMDTNGYKGVPLASFLNSARYTEGRAQARSSDELKSLFP